MRSYQERCHHAARPGEQNDLQTQDIHYYCDIQSAQNPDALFWATACRHQADLAEEVVFVCDGAAWIWNLIERHFTKAVQIVDWYHASRDGPCTVSTPLHLHRPKLPRAPGRCGRSGRVSLRNP